jgi:hypothetical protein
MLMLLGRYFKMVIQWTARIENNIQQDKDSLKSQRDFFLSKEVLNYLSSAAKMYIENARQELRISIALSRNPNFQEETQKKALTENIMTA